MTLKNSRKAEADVVTIRKDSEMFANVDRIWEIISETDNDQKYWTAIRDIYPLLIWLVGFGGYLLTLSKSSEGSL
jgi:hypothetical protein